MNEKEIIQRGKLLLATSEKKYSTYLRHEIMTLFGRLKPEQKEEAAQKAIPLIENSKTEEAALNAVREMIELF